MKPIVRSVIYSVILGMGWSGCNSLFYYPSPQLVLVPHEIGLNYEDVHFPTTNGLTLHGWFLPAIGAAKGTVLFFHGNAENISTHIIAVHWLPLHGYNVFLADYRGYGRSEGTPSLIGVHDDAAAVFDYIVTRSDIDSDRLIVFGQSLGGAIAIHAVTSTPQRNKVKALIVESAFSSYRKIAQEKIGDTWLGYLLQYPLSLLIVDKFSPLKDVGGVAPIPILFIHGERDTIVPAHHSKDLFAVAGEPKELWLIPGGTHIGTFASEINRKHLLQFIERALSQ